MTDYWLQRIGESIAFLVLTVYLVGCVIAFSTWATCWRLNRIADELKKK